MLLRESDFQSKSLGEAVFRIHEKVSFVYGYCAHPSVQFRFQTQRFVTER